MYFAGGHGTEPPETITRGGSGGAGRPPLRLAEPFLRGSGVAAPRETPKWSGMAANATGIQNQ